MPSLPEERFDAFLLGVLLGVLAGGLLVAAAAGWLLPVDRTASPTSSMTTATGCHDDPVEGGWIGFVPVGDGAVVVLNYTVVHDAAEVDVRGDLPQPADDAHVYSITTAPVTDERKEQPPDDCQPGTVIEAAVSLPREFGTLSIVLDGRTVATVQSGSGATFRPIDGPAG